MHPNLHLAICNSQLIALAMANGLAISLHLFSLFPQIRPQFPALCQPFYFETRLSRGSNALRLRETNLAHRKADTIERNE